MEDTTPWNRPGIIRHHALWTPTAGTGGFLFQRHGIRPRTNPESRHCEPCQELNPREAYAICQRRHLINKGQVTSSPPSNAAKHAQRPDQLLRRQIRLTWLLQSPFGVPTGRKSEGGTRQRRAQTEGFDGTLLARTCAESATGSLLLFLIAPDQQDARTTTPKLRLPSPRGEGLG